MKKGFVLMLVVCLSVVFVSCREKEEAKKAPVKKVARSVSVGKAGPIPEIGKEVILIPFKGKNGKWGYKDESGRVVAPAQFDRAESFFENMAAIVIDDKWGFVNHKGELVIEPQFEWAMYFTEGLAPVRIRGKWGYVDRVGAVVIEPRFDMANDFYQGEAEVDLNGQRKYIDRSGKVVAKAKR